MKLKLTAGWARAKKIVTRRQFVAGAYQMTGIAAGSAAGAFVHPAAGFGVLAVGLVAFGVALERD